jgi:MFS family permease
MAEVSNQEYGAADTLGTESPQSHEHTVAENDPAPRGKPWMYTSTKLGPIKIPYYASPPFQLGLVAFVCFLCPGMFNAVNGLGAAGQVQPHDINNAATAIYATFSVVGFVAGSIANRIGLKLTLGLGGFGYFLYLSSILSYNHNKNAGFLIFSGAILGVCAALLWTAQGVVMMSYPPENNKGKYISWFWMIFNLGAVIGSLVSASPLAFEMALLRPTDSTRS